MLPWDDLLQLLAPPVLSILLVAFLAKHFWTQKQTEQQRLQVLQQRQTALLNHLRTQPAAEDWAPSARETLLWAAAAAVLMAGSGFAAWTYAETGSLPFGLPMPWGGESEPLHPAVLPSAFAVAVVAAVFAFSAVGRPTPAQTAEAAALADVGAQFSTPPDSVYTREHSVLPAPSPAFVAFQLERAEAHCLVLLRPGPNHPSALAAAAPPGSTSALRSTSLGSALPPTTRGSPPPSTPSTPPIEHYTHLFQQIASGDLVISGTVGGAGSRAGGVGAGGRDAIQGMHIYRSADRASVSALMRTDPAVRSGLLTFEVLTFVGVPGWGFPAAAAGMVDRHTC